MPGSRRPWTPARALLPLVASCATFAAFLRSAHAQQAPAEPIIVAYAADGACPREDDFVASVRRYTTKWTAVDAGSGLRTFKIHLGPRAAEYTGTLVITMPDGKGSTRELAGPDCVSVARAFAVMVALAIDPLARVGEPGPGEELAALPEPEPEKSDLPEHAPIAVPDPMPAARRGRATAPGEPPARSPERLHFTFAVEGRAELTSAVVSGALPIVGAALEMRAHLGSRWPAWLSPSIALGVRQSLPKQISVGPGASEFLWTAATIRLCPVRFAGLVSRLEVAPCVEIDAGALRAEARGLPDARATTIAWFDRGVSVRGSYRIGPAWAVGAGVLLAMPWSRDRFALASGQLISRAPAVGVTGGLLLELEL